MHTRRTQYNKHTHIKEHNRHATHTTHAITQRDIAETRNAQTLNLYKRKRKQEQS